MAHPTVDSRALRWAEDDPESLREGARWISSGKPAAGNPNAARLMALLSRDDDPASGRVYSQIVLRARPESVEEAVLILIAHGDAVRKALEHPSYLDPEMIGGWLDRDLMSE